MVDKIHFPINLKNRDYDLAGPNGNAFSVMGSVSNIIKQIGEVLALPKNEIELYLDEYRKKATSGDYEHLLKVSNEYVEFNWIRDEEEEEDY